MYTEQRILIHLVPSSSLPGFSTSTSCTWPSSKRRRQWDKTLDAATLQLPRTRECFELISADDKLDWDLPLPNMLAGKILVHCYSALDRILEKNWPCIYKIGVTHCAHYRFYNDVFGYQRESDQWEKLTVIYASPEAISPAFVEAAVIQRHKGFFDG